MQRARLWIRLGLLLVAAGGAYWFAKRQILDAYVGTEPIGIDAVAAATFERAFPQLEFERPIAITFLPDGTRRLAVVEQCGVVRIFPNDQAVEQASELIDIRSKVSCLDSSNEEGLLGLAFHPKFRDNRQFFLYYTTSNHTNVLSRFKMSAADPAHVELDSEEELLRTPQREAHNHNGGTIVFGPDGFLYLAVGDGGPTGDPNGVGQSLQTVLGKILRIDVDLRDPGLKYAVPKDNPFVGRPDARGEIWAFGLRNVWRMAFDRQTRRLWAGDVGDDAWEEIDLIERGGNYGWSVREGFHKFSSKSPPPAPPQTASEMPIDPVFAYNHSIGNCIVGGSVYRGRQVPELDGAYLFADYVAGQVYALRYDATQGRATSVARVGPKTMTIYSFGEDDAGEVYFLTSSGIVNRIVPVKNPQR